jgi:single-strand DNA-binding protein
MNINTVAIIGNLTRDAEIKYFNNGNAIIKGSIALNRRKKQGDAYVDEAQFFDFSFGGKGAEAVHKYLTKGKQIGIQGELAQDRWEQDGQARSKIYIRAFTVQLLGSKEGGQGGTRAQGSDDEFADDIPF